MIYYVFGVVCYVSVLGLWELLLVLISCGYGLFDDNVIKIMFNKDNWVVFCFLDFDVSEFVWRCLYIKVIYVFLYIL